MSKAAAQLEWENLVRDTKILAHKSEIYNGAFPADNKGLSHFDDLHLYLLQGYRPSIHLAYA